MAAISVGLKVAIGLLMVVSIIELSFVTSMVAWLHSTASNGFDFVYNGSKFHLAGTPSNFLVDQGHTSNGAAGTAFVLIGLGGIISLSLRTRSGGAQSSARNILYYMWLVTNVLALLLTIVALGYVFAVTNAHAGQTIDAKLASGLNGAAYPLETWTPQNWFSAVLRLDLVDARSDIENHLSVMRGWQYNLIPFFIVQLCETVLAYAEFMAWRRGGATVTKEGSPTGGKV